LAKSHTLTVVNGSGEVTRKVDPTERLLVRAGRNLTSWQVTELERFSIEPREMDEQAVAYIATERGGRYEVLPRGSTIELGDNCYNVGDLFEFTLAPIPKPREPEPLYEPGTIRVEFLDGSTTQLEKVGRVYDVNPDGTTELLHESELAGVMVA
jgi:hypothetical protein